MDYVKKNKFGERRNVQVLCQCRGEVSAES
jgi:hypothetical protein